MQPQRPKVVFFFLIQFQIMKVSQRLEEMQDSATIKMDQLARDLKASGKDIISLSLGEPDFDTPEFIKEAAWKALQDGHTKYTPVPGITELRKAISAKFKRENNLDYSIDEIVVSNGAKQSIANVCLALLNPGDEVILFTPYWVSYFEIVRLAGGNPVELSAGIETDFKITADQLKKAITSKTRLIIYSSPCNPTGSVFAEDELREISEVILAHKNLMVLSDEIYEYINFTDTHYSIGSIAGMKERTITVNGFSKGFAMTGWRLGYMGAPLWLAKGCSKIQSQFTSGANSFSQVAAVTAINEGAKAAAEMKKTFLKRKELVLNLLREIPSLKVNNPQGAFYIFVDASSLVGKSLEGIKINTVDDFCMALLDKAGVALVPGSAFGAQDCFRISYASSDADLIEAVQRIKATVEKIA